MTIQLYDHVVHDLAGNVVDLQAYKSSVLLVVNVASRCGFTPQYAELQQLHEAYHDRGLVILAFPCNQFLQQEPGDACDIQAFSQSRYGVSFNMMEKVAVNGKDAHPFFQQLKREAKGLLGTTRIKWNFTKFLVAPTASDVQRFSPKTSPLSLRHHIERWLVL